MKTKNFGKAVAFEFIDNGKLKNGISLRARNVKLKDEFDGDWITLTQAKKILRNLDSAIAYIEANGERRGRGKVI